jgi:predicted transcriptional regulator of viral defense system
MPPARKVDGTISQDMEGISAHQRVVGREQLIAGIAERQHGVVALEQLAGLGVTEGAAQERRRAGRLHRVHQGVYAVGHPLLPPRGGWMAAVLACGPDAVLSHRSAAGLWGLRADTRSRVDVTAPNRRGRAPAGIDAHRDGSLKPDDRTVELGIPCTTVARTLLDLAAVVSERELRNAIVEAEVLRVFDLAAVEAVLRRSRRRRGVARLRRAIAQHDPRRERTRRELERRFLDLCTRAGLPPPHVNVPISLDGEQVQPDFLWRASRLIVEADGRESHGTATAFERDRRRDQLLMRHGWRVVRCTWRQVTESPGELKRTLRVLLAS